ncbi:MAG: hypothetical protein ACOCUI_01910, partial [bacterium]
MKYINIIINSFIIISMIFIIIFGYKYIENNNEKIFEIKNKLDYSTDICSINSVYIKMNKDKIYQIEQNQINPKDMRLVVSDIERIANLISTNAEDIERNYRYISEIKNQINKIAIEKVSSISTSNQENNIQRFDDRLSKIERMIFDNSNKISNNINEIS